MFQIPGNRCHFNSFNKDMTFWGACFLLPPNLAWPTGIAFPILASNHTGLIDLYIAPPRLLHLAVCITPPKFKFGQQSRGWVEIRRDDACQFKPNTDQNILFKAALISHFILTRNQMAARCLMWKGSCSDNPTLLSPDSALPLSSLYHLSAHYSGFIITFLFWFMITLFIKPVSSSRRWLFLAWKLGLKATAHYLFNTKQQS